MANCPICKNKKVEHDFRPFCSKRCSDVDLAKWMNNSYVISSDSVDDDGEESEMMKLEKNTDIKE